MKNNLSPGDTVQYQNTLVTITKIDTETGTADLLTPFGFTLIDIEYGTARNQYTTS